MLEIKIIVLNFNKIKLKQKCFIKLKIKINPILLRKRIIIWNFLNIKKLKIIS